MENEKKEKRARGEGRIFVRGRIVWIQYQDARHQQVRVSTDPQVTTDTPDWEKKAAKQLRKKLGEVAAGIVQDPHGIKYEHLRDAYLADAEMASKKSLRHDKEGNAYFESVRRLDKFFEGTRAVDIDTDLVRAFRRKMREDGLSNPTVNRSVASLRRMFTLAQKDGKIRNLPFFPMLPESKPRKGTLPHESYPALLKELPDYLRPVVTIGYQTGMRLGEILGLRWSNLLWLDRIIRIEDSKNNEPREIPVSGELETVLREQFAKRQDGCDRVCFRIDRLGHARPIGNFRKPWRRACVKIGLGHWEPVLDSAGQPVPDKPRYARSKPRAKMVYRGLIFHDLRRTFITDAEHSGQPRHEVMEISGHKTESVYKRYAIKNRERRRVVLAQIDEYRAKQFGDNSGTMQHSEEVVSSVTQ